MGKSTSAKQNQAEGVLSLRHDSYESGYQEALAWRRRMRRATASLAERNMWGYYFDLLATSATAWRGRNGGEQ